MFVYVGVTSGCFYVIYLFALPSSRNWGVSLYAFLLDKDKQLTVFTFSHILTTRMEMPHRELKLLYRRGLNDRPH